MIIGSLFSGGPDGIALGVQLATLGRVAWHAEIDEAASAVLAAHWRCPNLGDVTAIDWSKVEPVDALVGGFPCQDISVAGKGAGLDGDRSGLWREFVRAIRALRPRFVFVENVPALFVRGFGQVAADLAACGYRFAWARLGSDDVGGCHRRKRLWILATPDADGAGLRDTQQRQSGRWPGRVRDERRPEPIDDGAATRPSQAGRGLAADGCINAPDADRIRLQRVEAVDGSQGALDVESGDDAHRRSAGASGVSGGDSEVGEDPRPPSASDGVAAFELNPAFVEWMMGFPEGWTAMAKRRDRLRMLGNAAQPQVVMAAWCGLMGRLAGERQEQRAA